MLELVMQDLLLEALLLVIQLVHIYFYTGLCYTVYRLYVCVCVCVCVCAPNLFDANQ